MENKNKKLGRGLEAIYQDYNLIEKVKQLEESPVESQVKVSLELIDPNPFQPRIKFDKSKIEELATSIKVYGVITPILVREVAGRYQLVAGERRSRAARSAGLTEIPAVIASFTDEQMMEIALVENIQRENLTVIEEAQAYQNMIKELNYTQDILAKRVGKSRSHIANMLRLLMLPKEVQLDVVEGKLSMGQVKPLIGLKNSDILEIASKIKKEKLTSRNAEEIVKKEFKSSLADYQIELEQLLKKYNIEVVFTKNSAKLIYKNSDSINSLIKKLK